MVHSDGIWNDILDLEGKIENKAENGAFETDAIWYDILTCRENFESNKAKWCILTLFEAYARRLLGWSAIANVNQASETSTYIYAGTCMS